MLNEVGGIHLPGTIKNKCCMTKITYILVPQSATDPYNHHSERSTGNSTGRKCKRKRIIS